MQMLLTSLLMDAHIVIQMQEPPLSDGVTLILKGFSLGSNAFSHVDNQKIFGYN